MLTTEFKLEDAIEVWKEEGREEGIIIGEARGVNRLAELIKKGYDIDTALKMIKENTYGK